MFSEFLSATTDRIGRQGLLFLSLNDLPTPLSQVAMKQLGDSSIASLKEVSFSWNPSWWSQQGLAFPQLLTLLSRQTNLKEFYFMGNCLISEQTSQLFECFAKPGSFESLEQINLEESCNFDSSKSLKMLAQIDY